MNRRLSWSLLASSGAIMAALTLGACGQSTTETTSDTAMASDTSTAPAMPTMSPVSTADFIQKAAMSDMFEVQAGQLASTRAGNAQIKAFARQMVTAHRATTAALQAAMNGQTGLPTPPTALDEEHTNMLNDLRNANAAEFDQKYVDNQTHAHEDALSLMQNYAQNGDNTAIRAFATDTAPKVQQHLDMIRQLDHSGADEPSAAHP